MLLPKKCALVYVALFSMLAVTAGEVTVPAAAPGTIPKDRSMFAFQLENDFFSGIDGNYTNGARAAFISQSYSGFEEPHDHFCGNMTSSYIATGVGTILGGTNAAPGWSRFMGMDRTPNLRQQWAVTLTQSMFTPEHKSADPILGERTYAGYLGVGFGTLVKNETRANSLELQIGVTGDPSMTRNTQHFVHKHLNMMQWPGWDYQLPSEVTFCFFFKRYYRLEFLEHTSRTGRFETDGFAYWHADLGTLYLRGGIGGQYRFGYNLPSSSPELMISGATYPTSPFARERKYPTNWSCYGFVGMAGRYVGRDMFLDGTAFHSSPKYVDKFPFVADATAGMGVRYKNGEFIVGYMFRTKEYHTQDKAQILGSVEFRYSF